MILIPVVMGTVLRIYKIWSNYYFTGELGKELLYARNYMNSGTLPLIGMSTSHEWLNYGPIYYWILIPLMKIFGGSPYILFWLALAVSVIGILITYYVFKKIVGKKFAIILASFISVSPLWIWATRLSKLHTFFFILIPLVILFMYKVWNGKRTYMIWLGVAFGAIFSFHFSQLPFFIVIFLMFYIKRRSLKFKDYLLFLAGLLIPNITILIYDAQNGFAMLRNLVLWIPYRFAGFVGILQKNNLDGSGGAGTLSAFNEFFGRNLFDNKHLWAVGSVIFIALFVMFFVRNRKKYKKDFFVFYVITSTIVQCFALLIHTNPPLHYFFPIFLNFGLLFSHFATKFWVRPPTKILTAAIFILLFITGILNLNNEHINDVDYIPLYKQEKAIEEIVDMASGRSFNLVRVGPYDYFPENYSQNYKYLILNKGGKIDPNSNLIYTITESDKNISIKENAKN